MPEIPVAEVGTRNSKSDKQLIQTMHDSASALGADCGLGEMAESARFPLATQQDFDAILTLAEGKGFKIPAKESAGAANPPGLRLVESTPWVDDDLSAQLTLIESAGAEMEIKIIKPGAGASAFYPAEVLKRDGPTVFRKDTQIYINHATKAEEAARPEGDWHKLAGALSSDAYWKETGKYGEGLYAMAKFAPALAPLIREKAPYSGMSIRANGEQAVEAGRKVTREGLPVLSALTSAESVDIVTRAGAGGLILTEAARAATQEEPMAGITAEEAKVMIQEAVGKAVAPYQTRLLESDARTHAAELLESVSLPPAAKRKIIDRAVANLPRVDGALDLPKFREVVVAEAKAEGEYLAAINPAMAGRITGMGTAPVDPVKLAESQREADAKLRKGAVKIFESMGMSKDAAAAAASTYGEEAA